MSIALGSTKVLGAHMVRGALDLLIMLSNIKTKWDSLARFVNSVWDSRRGNWMFFFKP